MTTYAVLSGVEVMSISMLLTEDGWESEKQGIMVITQKEWDKLPRVTEFMYTPCSEETSNRAGYLVWAKNKKVLSASRNKTKLTIVERQT